MIGGGNAVEDVLEGDVQTLSVADLELLEQLLHCAQHAVAPDSSLITQTLKQLQSAPVTIAAALFNTLCTCYVQDIVKVRGALAFRYRCA